jgi:hypothetical protein
MNDAVRSRPGCLKKAQSCLLLAGRSVLADERNRWLRLAEYWVAQSEVPMKLRARGNNVAMNANSLG